MAGNDISLGKQNTSYQVFFDQYVGGAGTPTQVAVAYLTSDGINGAIYWDLWENNVAGSGAILIEGTDFLTTPSGALASASGTNSVWQPVGYYTIIANGATQDTLTRVHAAVTLTQNTLTRLQMLDAYKFMRARVTANGSSASLSAVMYGVGQ